MRRRIRSRLTYANIVATLALIMALAGGTAWAVDEWTGANIQDRTLTTADYKNNDIRSVDVRDDNFSGGGLTGTDIANNDSLGSPDIGGLGGGDITDGSLTGADISDNTIGVNDIGSQQVASDEVLNDSLLQSDIRAGAVTGDEVLDNSLTGFDIQNGQLGQVDLADGAVNGAKVANESLTGFDIQNGQLGQVDLADGAVNSNKVADNSLTGADINESTLNMPPTTTATFAAPPGVVELADAFTKIVGRNLPAGSYAVTATANIRSPTPFPENTFVLDAVCELRNGASFIGGASDRREIPGSQFVRVSLSMNGGAQVPSGGGEVSLWCRYQGGTSPTGWFDYGQMMIIRLDGFF